MGVVVLLLLLVGLRYARKLQAQAEFCTVQSTLGALRTALVIHQVQTALGHTATPQPKAKPPSAPNLPPNSPATSAASPTTMAATPAPTTATTTLNPFSLLAQEPANYNGERSSTTTDLVPGMWVFDAQCPCIGYLPKYFQSATNTTATQPLWFFLKTASNSPVLVVQHAYEWEGLFIQ